MLSATEEWVLPFWGSTANYAAEMKARDVLGKMLRASPEPEDQHTYARMIQGKLGPREAQQRLASRSGGAR